VAEKNVHAEQHIPLSIKDRLPDEVMRKLEQLKKKELRHEQPRLPARQRHTTALHDVPGGKPTT
jgi:hypothetical protein